MSGRGRGRRDSVDTNSGRGRGRSIGSSNSGRGRGRGRGAILNSENSISIGPSVNVSNESLPPFEDPGEQQNVTPFSSKLAQPTVEPAKKADYDHLSNIMKLCHINQTEYLMTLPPDDPEREDVERTGFIRCFCSLFLYPGLKPKFPKFPRGRNPFDLLPLVRDGIYPFDSYGRMLFNKEMFDRWRANPKSADLLELQIKKLIQLNKLAGRWDQCFVTSEYSNFGSLHEWKFGREFPETDRPDRPVACDPAEPDSGFVEGEPGSVDPFSGDFCLKLANLAFNEKWAVGTGNGYVTIEDSEVQSSKIILIITVSISN